MLLKIRGAKVLKSLESRAIRVILANLKGAIRVKFTLESNVIRHSNGTIQYKNGTIRHKKGATKGIMC